MKRETIDERGRRLAAEAAAIPEHCKHGRPTLGCPLSCATCQHPCGLHSPIGCLVAGCGCSAMRE